MKSKSSTRHILVSLVVAAAMLCPWSSAQAAQEVLMEVHVKLSGKVKDAGKELEVYLTYTTPGGKTIRTPKSGEIIMGNLPRNMIKHNWQSMHYLSLDKGPLFAPLPLSLQVMEDDTTGDDLLAGALINKPGTHSNWITVPNNKNECPGCVIRVRFHAVPKSVKGRFNYGEIPWKFDDLDAASNTHLKTIPDTSNPYAKIYGGGASNYVQPRDQVCVYNKNGGYWAAVEWYPASSIVIDDSKPWDPKIDIKTKCEPSEPPAFSHTLQKHVCRGMPMNPKKREILTKDETLATGFMNWLARTGAWGNPAKYQQLKPIHASCVPKGMNYFAIVYCDGCEVAQTALEFIIDEAMDVVLPGGKIVSKALGNAGEVAYKAAVKFGAPLDPKGWAHKMLFKGGQDVIWAGSLDQLKLRRVNLEGDAINPKVVPVRCHEGNC